MVVVLVPVCFFTYYAFIYHENTTTLPVHGFHFAAFLRRLWRRHVSSHCRNDVRAEAIGKRSQRNLSSDSKSRSIGWEGCDCRFRLTIWPIRVLAVNKPKISMPSCFDVAICYFVLTINYFKTKQKPHTSSYTQKDPRLVEKRPFSLFLDH